MPPPSQRSSCAAVMPAAIGYDQRTRAPAPAGASASQTARITCGFTASTQVARVGGRGGVVGDDVHAEIARKRIAQLRRPVRPRGSQRRRAARDQAADQAAGHVAAADEGDGTGSGCGIGTGADRALMVVTGSGSERAE